jgi:uncharacterized DUF497 family protein
VSRIEFEWDEAKNLSNRLKHGVSFEEAGQVFDDPLYTSVPERVEDGERRWQTFGRVNKVLLMTAHTLREEHAGNESIEIIRIITARKATARERRKYEDEDG